MKKVYVLLFILLFSHTVFAQKKVARYYVGGKLYCTHTFFINNEQSEMSYLDVASTQNYKGSNYTSCATCRYENKYGVTVMTFQNEKYNNVFNLYIRYIDKENCILVFNTSDNDDEKIEVYLAKEVISEK